MLMAETKECTEAEAEAEAETAANSIRTILLLLSKPQTS